MSFFLFRHPCPALPLLRPSSRDYGTDNPLTSLAPPLDPSILPHNLRQLAISGDFMTAAELARVPESLPNLREFEFEITRHLPGPILPSPLLLPNLERLQITASRPYLIPLLSIEAPNLYELSITAPSKLPPAVELTNWESLHEKIREASAPPLPEPPTTMGIGRWW